MEIQFERDWRTILERGSGFGIRVGLLDTGVQGDHVDIGERVTAHYEIAGNEERVFRVERGKDWNEHGTACAGILQTVAPGAEIHSVQIIGDAPRGKPSKLIAGFRFAIDSGWDVINISAGAGRPHEELRELAKEARAKGIIVVAAKDNRPGEIGFPAAFPEVVAVDMEYFPEPLGFRFDPNSPVEVEANGIYIEAPCATGGRKFYTGSSFAAPHMAGIAARIKGEMPELDPRMFREVLAELAEPPVGVEMV